MDKDFWGFENQNDNKPNNKEFNDTQFLDLIQKILELYKKNNLEELELKVKDFEIKISSKFETDTDLLRLINIQSNLGNLSNLSNLNNLSNFSNVSQSFGSQLDVTIETQVNNEDNQNGEDLMKYSKLIRAPLSGNFYINVAGTQLITLNKNVKKGDVVCVIEAMKVMNEVNSEFDGIVKKIIPNNGDFVKEGDVIIILE